MHRAGEKSNPIHGLSDPYSSWSTINVSEAVPGVLTPLGWSVWGPAAELGARAPFHAMGAIPKRMVTIPERPEDRVVNVFFGRVAIRVDFLCEMGDLIPGASGEALARQVFGFVPPGYTSRASRRRWPVALVRFPTTFLRLPGTVRAARVATDPWWRAEITRNPHLGLADALGQLTAASERFTTNLLAQAIAVVCVIQPIYDQLTRLAAKAGIESATLMSGHGSHEETRVIEDLWAVSRDRLSLNEFLSRHGYHGPGEGELAGVPWREDPTPLLRMLEGYRSQGNDADPARAEAARAAERRAAEAEVLASLSGARRAQARLLLRLAGRNLGLRGVGKVAFLQALDVARAAARRVGTLLAADGTLAEPEDVFFLTVDELTRGLPADPRSIVAERRALRDEYARLRLPTCWTGLPEAEPAEDTAAEATRLLTGVGASPGVVEGRACVVSDPSTADVVPGDILVAHSTDPGWASLMFLAKALVVDIGGLLSHAAVVARELGIPCVMNTQTGTGVLRTGDVCRVDGRAGTVEILERSGI